MTKKRKQTETLDGILETPVVEYEKMGEKGKDRILLIHTGGTLCMERRFDKKLDQIVLSPSLSLKQVLERCDASNNFLSEYNLRGVKVSQIDSTEVEPRLWTKIIRVIEENYNDFDGFVIFHGTDTMAYSAAAMAFGLRNLAKPVVLTGAQMILAARASDVVSNLTGAISVAASDLAQVALYFNGKIFSGTRVEKTDDQRLDGFDSIGYGPIGYVTGKGVELFEIATKRGRYTPGKLDVHPNYATSIVEVVLAPGLSPKIVKAMIEESGECKGCVLRAYGPGNLPSRFIPLIKEMADKGLPIYITSQCAESGITEGSEYAVGVAAVKAGGIPLPGYRPIAATVKLMNILAETQDPEQVKRQMLTMRFADEINLSKYVA